MLERRVGRAFIVGGPTVVIDLPNTRIVIDPTFDRPGKIGPLHKTEPPAVAAEDVTDTGLVLISHADHTDNLDVSGRAFALRAPQVVTSVHSAQALNEEQPTGTVSGLAPWESLSLDDHLAVTAVPAFHGPRDGERSPEGWLNADVIGFVVEHVGAETPVRLYISGDNTAMTSVLEVRERFGHFDAVVLNAGAARVPAKFGGRPLSFTAERAAVAAELLGAPAITVHQQGWAHFSQGPQETATAFASAGIADLLDPALAGDWSRPFLSK